MPKNNLLEDLQRKSEAFKALPTGEQIRRNRETRLANLTGVGYLTSDEAQQYGEPIKELPKDRKGLIVAYLLTGVENMREASPTLGDRGDIQTLISSLPERAHQSLQEGGSLSDGMDRREMDEAAEKLFTIRVNGDIRRASLFIDTKRQRMRKRLLTILTYEICHSLLQKEKSIEPIPYLKDLLKDAGYRERAKSLNDTEEKAIQSAALHYLDLLEVAFLTGEARLRYEQYDKLRDEEGAFREDFYYSDELDEALLEFENVYYIMESAIVEHYADDRARGILDYLEYMFNEIRSDKYSEEELIQGSKFARLFKEEEQC